jgi:hypothetical protein
MLHDILQDFPGSQDGTKTEQFKKGTQVELSDYLAACIPADWARPVKTVEIENKAIITDGTVRRKTKSDKEMK